MKLDRHTRRSGEVETGKGRLAEKKERQRISNRENLSRGKVESERTRWSESNEIPHGYVDERSLFKEDRCLVNARGKGILCEIIASEAPRIRGKRGRSWD